MKRVVTADEMRAYEGERFADGRASSLEWMERAAGGVDALLKERYPNESVLVVCSTGNNGGDGFALLRMLVSRGVSCAGVLLGDPEKLRGDAKTNYLRALESGIAFSNELADTALKDCGVIVDAMFGTGISRPLAGAFFDAAERVNASGKPVVAVDIPSGVDATTGAVLGTAVRAKHTVTFEFLKRGHLLFPGRSLCGEVRVQPLSGEEGGEFGTALIEKTDVADMLPPREKDSHKGSNGRALLCVGSERYTGAALMCAGAALRSGTGLLSVAVPGRIKAAFSLLPEAMAAAVNTIGDWDAAANDAAIALLDKKNAVCIGCGVGEGDVTSLIARALETRVPLVLDADALNQIAQKRALLTKLHQGVILTPHPAEMARLTGGAMDEILRDPVGTARHYASAWNCVVLLKGATTCVSNGACVRLNTTGNSGLAKGGSGDVLSGIVTALLAQGLSAFDAASAGAFLLGASADTALELLGTRMLMARDVIDAVQKTISSYFS
jgi:NAD(P)H-hydrate epimerase